MDPSLITSGLALLVAIATSAGKLVGWLRARAEGDSAIAKRALKMVSQGREETGRHVHARIDCERRCAELETKNSDLSAKIAELEAENADLLSRVGYLERETALMRTSIEALLRGDSEPPLHADSIAALVKR